MGRLIYAISDIVIYVSTSPSNYDSLKSIFEVSKQVEIRNKPVLILICNKLTEDLDDEKLKVDWEKILEKDSTIKMNEKDFELIEYVSIPSCLVHDKSFEKKISTTNVNYHTKKRIKSKNV
jgi:hypothetical protein